jgi:hypothetical protein
MSARVAMAAVMLLVVLGCEQEPDQPQSTVPVVPQPTPPADLCTNLPQRVRLANDLLHGPVPDPDRAMAIYAEVLAANASGCALATADDWSARQGTGIAHMMKGNWPRARVSLEDASRRWPRSATTRYNLACALCRTGDLEGCYQELTAALANAGPSGSRDFLADRERTRADFATLARTDPDLELLRADPRFERVVAP